MSHHNRVSPDTGAETSELAELEARLQSRVLWDQLAAAEALGDYGEAAVPALCKALLYLDEGVCTAAAGALGKIGAPAIAALDGRAGADTAVVRESAIRALGYCGPEAVPVLERALASRYWKTRLAAVKALRSLKLPETIPHFYRALKDRESRVRLAAVEALGEVGDETAVVPLHEVLRDGLVGRSPWGHLAIGLLLCITLGPIGLITLDRLFALNVGFGALFLSFWGHSLVISLLDRRRRSEVARAVMEALVSIGERNPTPELRAVLPDLRLMASRWFQQDGQISTVSGKAVRRIEELTKELKDLPLPGSASGDEASLPRVAEAPAVEEATLPRVR